MRYVDIITAHKVEITYELATLQSRILAFFLDFLAMVAIALLGSLLLSFFIADEIFESAIFYLTILPLVLFYNLIAEVSMKGQTPGKKVAGIRVMKLNGGEAGFFDYAVRWCFRPIDIWMSIGTIGMILINASSKGQRIGDMLAGTVVINSKSNTHFRLSDVLSSREVKDYKVTYPAVLRFNEQQMLVLKETLERSRVHNNYAHTEAMSLLAEKVAEKLDLEDITMTEDAFLKTVLRDYVYLTR